MFCSLFFLSPFCAEFEDGTRCSSSSEAGCDPAQHAGAIDRADWMTTHQFETLVAEWHAGCPTASAATCTAADGPAAVECVVYEPIAVRKRLFCGAVL